MCLAYRVLCLALAGTLAHPRAAAAQAQPDVWREFVQAVDVGTELTVRLHNGQRFRAMVVGKRDSEVLLQPKTRVPVPVQPVPYGAILSLERRSGGNGTARTVAIGVASGVGAFFGVLLFLLAAD
jgi:hypothetical protein